MTLLDVPLGVKHLLKNILNKLDKSLVNSLQDLSQSFSSAEETYSSCEATKNLSLSTYNCTFNFCNL